MQHIKISFDYYVLQNNPKILIIFDISFNVFCVFLIIEKQTDHLIYLMKISINLEKFFPRPF